MNYTAYTREMLADCLQPARARMPVLAAELGISQEQLRRRLANEGTTWLELYDAEIIKRTKQMRAEGVCTADIADALGYATPQALTRHEARHRQGCAA